MNRRTLFGMVLGALAGGSVTNIAWAAVERNLTPAAPPLAPSVRTPSVCTAELFVSIGADVSAAIAGLTRLGGKLGEAGWHSVDPIGPLIISNKAEMQVFATNLAESIGNAKPRADGTFVF